MLYRQKVIAYICCMCLSMHMLSDVYLAKQPASRVNNQVSKQASNESISQSVSQSVNQS